MLFALAAHEAGLQSVLLGANTPLEGLPLAAKRASVDAIVLAGAVDAASEAWRESLAQLVARVNVPVLVGGGVSVHRHDIIVAAAQWCRRRYHHRRAPAARFHWPSGEAVMSTATQLAVDWTEQGLAADAIHRIPPLPRPSYPQRSPRTA